MTPSAPHSSAPPVVLCLSGHDPSGGAGLQADIEAIRALGAHPAVGITCLTVQDTRGLQAVRAVDDAWFQQVLELISDDLPIRAIKLGVLGSAGQSRQISELHRRLSDTAACPLVVDPVLAASAGGRLADDDTARALQKLVFPAATLLTPNLDEARALTGASDVADCAEALLASGAQWVLITGADNDPGDAQVEDQLWGQDGSHYSYRHARLAGVFHGSGCSLAAACAALLAHDGNASIPALVRTATDHVADWLAAGYRPGRGQRVPLRLPA